MPTTFWNKVFIHLVNIYWSFTLLYDPDCSKKLIFNQFEKINFFGWAAQSLNILNFFQVSTDNEKLWISQVLFYRQVSGHYHHAFFFIKQLGSWALEQKYVALARSEHNKNRF